MNTLYFWRLGWFSCYFDNVHYHSVFIWYKGHWRKVQSAHKSDIKDAYRIVFEKLSGRFIQTGAKFFVVFCKDAVDEKRLKTQLDLKQFYFQKFGAQMPEKYNFDNVLGSTLYEHPDLNRADYREKY